MNNYLIEYWKESDSWVITPMTEYVARRNSVLPESDYYYITQDKYPSPTEAFSKSYALIINSIRLIESSEPA